VTKKQKKEQVQKKWGLSIDGAIPIVLVSDVDHNIQKILEEIIDGIATIGIQLCIVDTDKKSFQKQYCHEWQGKYPKAIKCISGEEADNDVFDMVVLEDLTVENLKSLKEHKMVPVAEKGKIEPFDPIEEKGNGFVFEEGNAWSLFAALVRAAETYRFPYDWQNIVKAVGKSE